MPRRSPADVRRVPTRIHAALRLSDLSVVHAHASDVSGAESLRRFQWQEGQLVIGDRGYGNAPGIVWAVQQGADVLVRLNRGALPLVDAHGDSIDVIGWVRRLDDGEIAERIARGRCSVDGQEHTVTGRLVATRLPKAKIEEARKRVRKEQGADLTEETLEMAAYLVLFTTAPKARLLRRAASKRTDGVGRSSSSSSAGSRSAATTGSPTSAPTPSCRGSARRSSLA